MRIKDYIMILDHFSLNVKKRNVFKKDFFRYYFCLTNCFHFFKVNIDFSHAS